MDRNMDRSMCLVGTRNDFKSLSCDIFLFQSFSLSLAISYANNLCSPHTQFVVHFIIRQRQAWSCSRVEKKERKINRTQLLFFFFCAVLESVSVDHDDEAAVPAALVDESDEDLVRGQADHHAELLDESADTEQSGGEAVLVAAAIEAGAARGGVANVDSGEGESDDEWNYVKPKEEANLLGEGEGEVEVETVQKEEEKQEILEQHAEAQAIAESQEHCVEVSL